MKIGIIQTDKLPDFASGAAMAYRDCADFVDMLKRDLPKELESFGDVFQLMADGYREKAKNVELLFQQSTEAKKKI